MEIFKCLKDPSILSIIQAVSSFVLVIITGYYAYLTHKILTSQYQTHLRPVSISLGNRRNETYIIKVKNFGPSIALNVRLNAIAFLSHTWSKSSNKYFYVIKNISSNGPFEIINNSEAEYSFYGLVEYNYPIRIYWESLNGKKYKSLWFIINDGLEIIIRPPSFKENIKFRLKWSVILIKSPYVNLKKKYLIRFKGEKHL